MKAKVIEGCISCGICVNICPEVFKFNDEGVSQVYKQPDSSNEDKARSAAESCPVSVIETEG
ncbi:MAG: ferredoxin [Eubacteriales bacterium]|nr:ferredoxin [Eubacteriales bacterium]MCI7570898.1 ferredoxin [Clostridiales bacterium]MDD7550342.1 ferredoxin [Clostridia bacterium]MDY5755166.1 ferredoxin [Eubacteriales bacterium]